MKLKDIYQINLTISISSLSFLTLKAQEDWLLFIVPIPPKLC